MPDTIPVLFDTDIGSDIDDAVALAYLLRQARCELVGITTVTGDVGQRAACAEVICRAAGRQVGGARGVPIHCGISEVLAFGPGQAKVPQYEGIRQLPHRMDWKKNTAIEFMRDTIRSRPGEITLLSVGPFSNIAVLFALDPELPGMLRQWVSMGGYFFDPGLVRDEWNCIVDPVSTAIAYRGKTPSHVSVGLDVTLKCRMPSAEVRSRFVSEPLATVLKMAEVWFAGQAKDICFHDPLAATLLFQPQLCQYQVGRVDIAVDSSAKVTGGTHFTADPSGRDRVASGVDVAGFFAEYFGVFS